MTLEEGKSKFIEAFGTMATEWGINKSMAQVHALLMISDEPQTAEQVKVVLGISTGNTSTNLRNLIEWGLIAKTRRQKRILCGRKRHLGSDEANHHP
jgi:DNA-binding transcriptional regulator GbsR (MarR family)